MIVLLLGRLIPDVSMRHFRPKEAPRRTAPIEQVILTEMLGPVAEKSTLHSVVGSLVISEK